MPPDGQGEVGVGLQFGIGADVLATTTSDFGDDGAATALPMNPSNPTNINRSNKIRVV